MSLDNDKKINSEQLIEQAKQQIALLNVQSILSNMTQKCFQKCITSPGDSLSKSEEKCAVNCSDRFFESLHIITNAYRMRMKQERQMS